MTADERVRSFDPAARAALADLRSNVKVIDVATTPLLSPAECDELIGSCDPDLWHPAKRRGASSADVLAGKQLTAYVDTDAKSRLEQALPGGATGAFAERIYTRVIEINEEVFGFRVVGLEEPTRIMWYRGTHADHMREHIDVGPLYPLRKLSFSVLLSDPDTYEGGDLAYSGRPLAEARSQGTLAVFPAFLPHGVTPMQRGTRHVVVGWMLGPTFV